jgi:hypothetical protein
MFRRIINGVCFDIGNELKKKQSQAYLFYDRDLLVLSKYTHAQAIVREKIA